MIVLDPIAQPSNAPAKVQQVLDGLAGTSIVIDNASSISIISSMIWANCWSANTASRAWSAPQSGQVPVENRCSRNMWNAATRSLPVPVIEAHARRGVSTTVLKRKARLAAYCRFDRIHRTRPQPGQGARLSALPIAVVPHPFGIARATKFAVSRQCVDDVARLRARLPRSTRPSSQRLAAARAEPVEVGDDPKHSTG
jgi:hypothetical protein